MKVNNMQYRSIWVRENKVQIIDQRMLPHKFVIENLDSVNDAARAIKDMHVRGAPLIGATAGYGMYLAVLTNQDLNESSKQLISTRPTAIDLKWAVNRMIKVINNSKDKLKTAFDEANKITEEAVENCRLIGEYGSTLIEDIYAKKKDTVNILTHCNAGWLATVDYGTATAPIYEAFDKGVIVHVWVDETRPRNQGARMTTWELNQHGIPNTVIADNVGGHLMQHDKVDLVIVGTDRTTHTGDVCNKIGTYLKALAAKDNNIPFYVALPSSTIDWVTKNGLEIPIEERGSEEVKYIQGLDENGEIKKVLLTPKESKAANYAFDVTPRNYVTGLITERGICKPDKIMELFPEKGL